jgi:3-isopropylmalate/(R)-2-methylmalate dehydratase large subunit
VARGLRCLILPATPAVFRQAVKEGLLDIFLEAGAIVARPRAVHAWGGHMGILARGEKALATTNRKFVGRMGDPSARCILRAGRGRRHPQSPV